MMSTFWKYLFRWTTRLNFFFFSPTDLKVTGWTGEIASAIAKGISEGKTSSLSSMFKATFLIGITSTLSCSILNNQPMTILYTQILRDPEILGASDLTTFGALFSLVIGSNLGANLTLVGALAGLMWERLLREKGITINFLGFMKHGLAVMPFVLFVSLGVLSLELVVMEDYFVNGTIGNKTANF
eukprot:TRINITY_DN6331_c0_g1_i10.p1 TRINITY_DN6331_c0_g1~~TRINITY_DN6331_c0_g1_i10.p1  ORF type:complete len:185 (-),score=41.45 TRINITY_DN6331_c0_g1_i10:204-758(-)